MADLADHPSNLGTIRPQDLGIQLSQPQPPDDFPLSGGTMNRAPDERDLQPTVRFRPRRARLRFHCHIVSLVLFRTLATWSGFMMFFRARIVAWATVTGLLERRDLVRMSLIPASSMMTRTAPPAMNPVPFEAGRKTTRPAPCRPWTIWGMVVSARVMGTRLFLAASPGLAGAWGT